MKYIVYQTINITNNKIYVGVHKCENPDIFDGYIGCGIKITVPSSYINPITPLQFAVKKYGTKNFKRTILQVFDSKEEAFEFEKNLVNQSFINRLDTYNAKIGGFGGSSYSVPIFQFDLSGNLLKKWPSIKEAAEFYNISDTAIFNSSKFKGSSISYFWSKTDNIDITEWTHYSGQLCYKYMENGKYDCVYNSMLEAARANDVHISTIQRAVKGGYKVKGNFYSTELHEVYSGKPKISLRNKEIYIYSLQGDYITSLKGGKEICNFFNIKSTSSVTTAIRTGRQYKDYQISLEYKEKLEPLVDKRNKKKAVIQYSLTGDFINEFDSMTAASKKFGTGVQKVLKGQQKQCKGFIFKYKS